MSPGRRRWSAATSMRAFARPDVTIVDSHFRVGRQNHVSFEPRAVIASYEDGRYPYRNTRPRCPGHPQRHRAPPGRFPPSQVRVTVPAGRRRLRTQVRLRDRALRRAARPSKSGRPVKLVNSREEEMLTCLFRENAEIRIRSAVTQDGEIVGREAVVLMDCGAYGGEQIFLTTMTAHTLGGNYRLGSVRLVSPAVYTNTAPERRLPRLQRRLQHLRARTAHRRDRRRIGMDPLAFRRRNVLGDGDLGATGQVFEGDVLGPMLDRWLTMRAARTAAQSPRRWPALRPRDHGRHLVRLRRPIGGDRQHQCRWHSHARHIRRRDRLRLDDAGASRRSSPPRSACGLKT